MNYYNHHAADICVSHNDTLAFCKDVSQYNEYYTNRPLDTLLASRQAAYTSVMHYRSHTPLY